MLMYKAQLRVTYTQFVVTFSNDCVSHIVLVTGSLCNVDSSSPLKIPSWHVPIISDTRFVETISNTSQSHCTGLSKNEILQNLHPSVSRINDKFAITLSSNTTCNPRVFVLKASLDTSFTFICFM